MLHYEVFVNVTRSLKSLLKNKGRIFNTGGDSVFAEFPSAVAAVDTAVEFQNQIKDRNDRVSQKKLGRNV